MKFFRGKERVEVRKATASARYVDRHAQVVDLTLTSQYGDRVVVTLGLDQVHGLVGDLVGAYETCRPPLPDRALIDRVTAYHGM